MKYQGTFSSCCKEFIVDGSSRDVYALRLIAPSVLLSLEVTITNKWNKIAPKPQTVSTCCPPGGKENGILYCIQMFTDF